MFLHFEAVTPVLIHRKRCQKVLVCRLKWKTQQKTNRKHVCFMDYYGCLCVLPEHVPAARKKIKSFRRQKMLRIAREMVHLQFFQWTMLKVKKDENDEKAENDEKDEKDEKDPHPTTTCIKNPGFTQGFTLGEDHHGMVHGQLFHQYRRCLES